MRSEGGTALREDDAAPARASAGGGSRPAEAGLVQALQTLPGAEERPPKGAPLMSLGALQDALTQRLASALQMHPDELDLDETFFDLGVESVSAVEWIRALAAEYEIPIRTSALYDWPTLRRFAEYLHRRLEKG